MPAPANQRSRWLSRPAFLTSSSQSDSKADSRRWLIGAREEVFCVVPAPRAGCVVMVSRSGFRSEAGGASSLPQWWRPCAVGVCWLRWVGGCGPARGFRSALWPPPRSTMWWCRAGVWSGAPWPPCWVRLWPSRPLRAASQVPSARPAAVRGAGGAAVTAARPAAVFGPPAPAAVVWGLGGLRASRTRFCEFSQSRVFVSRCPRCLTSSAKNFKLGAFPKPSCFSVWSIGYCYKSTVIINPCWW